MSTWIRPTAGQLSEVVLGPKVKWTGPTIHLMKTVIPLTPTMTIADCAAVECDFTGYTALSAPLSVPVPFPDAVRGGVSFDEGTTSFVASSPLTVGNDVVGFFIEDTGGTTLLMAGIFTNPVSMQLALDQLNFAINLNYFGDASVDVTVNNQPN